TPPLLREVADVVLLVPATWVAVGADGAAAVGGGPSLVAALAGEAAVTTPARAMPPMATAIVRRREDFNMCCSLTNWEDEEKSGCRSRVGDPRGQRSNTSPTFFTRPAGHGEPCLMVALVAPYNVATWAHPAFSSSDMNRPSSVSRRVGRVRIESYCADR